MSTRVRSTFIAYKVRYTYRKRKILQWCRSPRRWGTGHGQAMWTALAMHRITKGASPIEALRQLNYIVNVADVHQLTGPWADNDGSRASKNEVSRISVYQEATHQHGTRICAGRTPELSILRFQQRSKLVSSPMNQMGWCVESPKGAVDWRWTRGEGQWIGTPNGGTSLSWWGPRIGERRTRLCGWTSWNRISGCFRSVWQPAETNL